jgi:hypothetical protein
MSTQEVVGSHRINDLEETLKFEVGASKKFDRIFVSRSLFDGLLSLWKCKHVAKTGSGMLFQSLFNDLVKLILNLIFGE